MSGEVDLKIVNGDFVFGPDGEPLFIKDAAVVAQDIAHRLREKGVAVGLIGDDSPAPTVLTALKTETEADTRLAPGTVKVTQGSAPGVFEITADTLKGDTVTVTVNG